MGPGTPTTLAVSMSGTRLRIEVHDPDPRALPTLTDVDADAESGRGMALIEAIADRWGVDLAPGHKATWCEFRTGLKTADGHTTGPRVDRAANVLGFYVDVSKLLPWSQRGWLGTAVAEEAAINVIADLLHWLGAHGRDSDEVLERAQTHFLADVEAL
ncbi:ATP-binding protein [Streptomyces sp. NPDC052107]|uniref:ATP-binding protein n=1 Tax=Streptomyces sp. NPDC052107 TaxID=3155632 RepID=UPI003430C5AC